MKIIHLSDVHIGHGGKAEKAKKLLELIAKEYENEAVKPLIIVTGDIVHTGAIENYDQAKSVFSPYYRDYEFLFCPGNHDYRSTGLLSAPDASRIQLFRNFLDQDVMFPTEKIIGDCHFFGLDSMAGEIHDFDFKGADGELGGDQLTALNYKIETTRKNKPDAKIIVYLHHHPFYYNYFKRLNDADDLKEVIRGHHGKNKKMIPKINILLFGHKHVEKRFNDNGNDTDKNKEKKYGIDLILASKQNNEVEIGIEKGTKNKPVFRFYEIDTDTLNAKPKEVKVKS